LGSADALMLPKKAIQQYLSSLYGEEVEVSRIWKLGETSGTLADLKGVGYGYPYVIEFKKINGDLKQVILKTMRPAENFGHDHFSDRAQIVIWQNSVFNKLPRHARSVDVGAFENGGQLKSVGKCSEFFILTEFVEGEPYHLDLDRMKASGVMSEPDEMRCLALSDYLVEIHKLRHNMPSLYVRRIRDLVGHGECIMGLLDSYPKGFAYVNKSYFIDVEKACVDWRWKLKERTHRLSQVHGDFHPWNILFREGADFTALDRSRGEWGEPADDIAALTINYLFYSLQKYGELSGVFQRLFGLFWENYLRKTHDSEILEVVQPFYAWRALVVASPIWYPNLNVDVRVKLLKFAKNVLQRDRFNLMDVNSYF
jgi:hypothetical protein